MIASQHSDESSSHNLISSVEVPINVFKNQIFLNIGVNDNYRFEIPFPTFHRHIYEKVNYDEKDLLEILKKVLNPDVINGIITTEKIMGRIQNIYPNNFIRYKIRFTSIKVQDIVNETRQEEIILTEHNRAHRNSQENKKQIIQNYYFPRMNMNIQRLAKQCTICKIHKYDRHPNSPKLQVTPIPQYPGHIIHIDIYITEGKNILTAVDKFSKYAQTMPIKTRSIEDLKEPLRDLLFRFGVPKVVVIDNEKSLNSATIKHMMHDQLKIEVITTPPYSSSVNGQVERFHSILSEIMRCLKEERNHRTFNELLDRAVYEYNCSIHSVKTKNQ